MQIGIDSAGKVWMVGDAVASGEWNGIEITAVEITEEQEAAYFALPVERAGVKFDGNAFAIVPLAPADLKAAVQAQISNAECGQLLARVTREGLLGAGLKLYQLTVALNAVVDYLVAQGMPDPRVSDAVAAATLLTPKLPDGSENPNFNIGVLKLKSFDDVISALRAQLDAFG